MASTTISLSGSTYVSYLNPSANNSGASPIVTNIGLYFNKTQGKNPPAAMISAGGDYKGAILRFERPSALKYKRIRSVKLHYDGASSAITDTRGPASAIAPYASDASLANVNWTTLETLGTIGSWTYTEHVSASTSLGYQYWERNVDVTSWFLSNLVNDVFNIIVCDSAAWGYQSEIQGTTRTVYGWLSNIYLTVEYDDVDQLAPSVSYPVNAYIREGDPVVFTWIFNAATEARQAAAILEYKEEDDDNYTVVTLSNYTSYSYSLPDGLPAGNYSWRVKVTNDANEASSYSSVGTFTVIGTPQAPVIADVENKCLPTIEWASEEQISYEFQLYDSVGRLLINEVVGSGTQQYKPQLFLSGNYSAKVRVKNTIDMWSDWAVKAFNISATAPTGTASITATASGNNVTIAITSKPEGSRVALLRSEAGGDYDVIMSLKDTDTEYIDRTVKSGIQYSYKLRAYIDGYVDSAAVTATVSYTGMILEGDGLVLNGTASEEEFLPHTEIIECDAAISNYSGRELPLIERSMYSNVQIERKFFISFADKPVLDKMLGLESVHYRDTLKNSFKCALLKAQYTVYRHDGYIVTLTLARVAEEEVILNV